jgi:hypothetical protein
VLLAGNKVIGCVVAARTECSISNLPRPRQGCPLKSAETSMLAAPMTRSTVAILSSLAVAACTSAQMPAAWTRTDGQPSDPAQIEAAKAICRGEMEQAELVTNARGLVPIQLPGQESPTLKVYIGCMARHGYTAAR